jgi:hypothetical protein
MRVQPIGITPSRLLISQWSAYHTHRVFRLGIAESLLVHRERIRRTFQVGWLRSRYVDLMSLDLKAADLLPPLWSSDAVKPLELIWPGEYQLLGDDDVIYVVEQMPGEPLPQPGSIVDILL